MQVVLDEREVMKAIHDAHEAGVKLEVHQGLPIWEFLPSPLHVVEVRRIERSIRASKTESKGCDCETYQDVTIRFPDGSVRRPDLAIFCEKLEATQEATTLVPGAVIEVVSPGSEIKDLELSPYYYIGQGVLDVVVFDPRTGAVLHFRKDSRTIHQTPVDIELECGCSATV